MSHSGHTRGALAQIAAAWFPSDMRTALLPLLLTFGVALAGSSAQAAPRKAEAGRAAALEALSACRKEADGAQRLACYDRAAAVLDEAEAKGQVVVLDREQVRSVRRQAFGFELPAFSLFRGRGGSAAEESVDRVTYTLAGGGGGGLGGGKAIFVTTEEGVTWIQTDDEPIERPAHSGSQLAVRRAALGSYFCNLDSQRAVRCQRKR